MGSESPYIVFELNPTTRVRWHSDNVETFAHDFGFPSMRDMEGRWVKIIANVRPAKYPLNDGITRLQVQRMVNMQDQ
jgi:hypothetical protein